MKKYEFTGEEIKFLGRRLRRIRAVRSFSDVEAGDEGGWIESENNLSHDGNAWVSGNARVCGNAKVYGNARAYDDADINSTNDYIVLSGFGSKNRPTTFYKNTHSGVACVCGCFSGTIDEFEAKVKETHGDRKYAREYLMCAELAKLHFGLEEKE